jgi:hypothetical protein
MASPKKWLQSTTVPVPSVNRVSECSPADSTNAAVNWRDFGMSRWQLSGKSYRIWSITSISQFGPRPRLVEPDMTGRTEQATIDPGSLRLDP